MYDWLQELWSWLLKDLGWFLEPRHWALNVQRFFASLCIIVAAVLTIRLVRRILTRMEARVERLRGIVRRRRIETITSLVSNTVTYGVYIASAFAISALWFWGLVESSFLAFGSAAVGAAIGFGSQGLVQDIITGLSILVEDQLAVGDYVDLGGKAGVVEEIGLRVVKLRDHFGVQHIVFNRNIAGVSNYSSGAVEALVDVPLAKAEDGEAATRVAALVCRDMAAELPYFRDVPEVEGVRQSSTHDVFLRLHLRILPFQQDLVNPLFVERLKRAFAAARIVVPEDRVRFLIVSGLFSQAVAKGKSGVSSKPQRDADSGARGSGFGVRGA
ncbi:MAG: mechanosensitive ion channel domain-containing protein [Planctomycetota bacterium]